MYIRVVGRSLNKIIRYLFIYVLIVAVMGLFFLRLPKSYLPDEDQGMLLIQTLLPSGSTLEQTQKIMDYVRDYFLSKEKDTVDSVMAISGQNMAGRGQNIGMAFVRLKDWKLRNRPEQRANTLADRAMRVFSQIRNAQVFAFTPPAVIELGNAKGFDFELQDRGGLGHAGLMAARNQLLGMAAKDPRLTRVRPNGLEDCAEYHIDIDWNKAGALGIPIAAIHNGISIAFGSSYINDFIKDGRVKHVDIQADAPYRMLPSDLEKYMCATTPGRWCLIPPLQKDTGHSVPPNWNVTMHFLPSTSGENPRRAEARERPCRRWRSYPPNCPRK